MWVGHCCNILAVKWSDNKIETKIHHGISGQQTSKNAHQPTENSADVEEDAYENMRQDAIRAVQLVRSFPLRANSV